MPRSAFALTLPAAIVACSVPAPQAKYTPADVVRLEPKPFAGQRISVFNQNGRVVVTGDPTATTVQVSALPFSFADDDADGIAAIDDVQSTIVIDEATTPGTIAIECHVAASDHGSARSATTGCDPLTVIAPSGTASAPLVLAAHAANGSCTAAGTLVLSDAPIGWLKSDNGAVRAVAAGSLVAHSGNGDVTVTISPNTGSTVAASSAGGVVVLALPSDFSADRLTLRASDGVQFDGFSDLTSSSTSRGKAGTGAASITATTAYGQVVVEAQ